MWGGPGVGPKTKRNTFLTITTQKHDWALFVPPALFFSAATLHSAYNPFSACPRVGRERVVIHTPLCLYHPTKRIVSLAPARIV